MMMSSLPWDGPIEATQGGNKLGSFPLPPPQKTGVNNLTKAAMQWLGLDLNLLPSECMARNPTDTIKCIKNNKDSSAE